ncbi:MAG: hypothetical protein NWR72_20620, partial [Bacteroidia bacterium]|nr:hypothetical protein [Bacteroidia bacterium]
MASSRSGCLRPFLVAVILFTSISIAILYVVYNSGQYLYEEDETSAYLIEGALVFDGENWLPGTPKVLIVDGKIQCMGPDCQLPVGSKTINAAGMTLLPGLTDLQVQFYRPTKEYEGLSNPERLLRFTKQRPEVRQNFHKAGVTQVRSCGDALKNIMALREQMEDLQFSGPDIYIVGPMITAVGGHPAVTEYAGNEYLIQEACRQVKDVEDMKQIIQELADNRVNTIKMVFTSFGGKVARLSNEALIAGIEMATSKGLLVSVLTGTEEEMVTAAEAGATLIEYGTRFPISAETAKLLRDRGV